jgi:hypothetical protein
MNIDKEKQELLEIAQQAFMEEGFEVYIYEDRQNNEPDFFVKTYNENLDEEYMLPVFVESSESLKKNENIKKIINMAKECDFQGQSCIVVLPEKEKETLENILQKEGLNQVVDIIDIPEE